MPLCRGHHQQLHRYGNERAWWANLQITPLRVALELWEASPDRGSRAAGLLSEAIPARRNPEGSPRDRPFRGAQLTPLLLFN